MIKIYKKGQTFMVPSGAFKSMYKPAGWSLEPDDPQEDAGGSLLGEIPLGGSNPPSGEGNGPSGPSTPPEGQEGKQPTEEETLQAMSDDELKQYASLLGIKTKGVKDREELMEAIRANKE